MFSGTVISGSPCPYHACSAEMLGCTMGLAKNENGCELCECAGKQHECGHGIGNSELINLFSWKVSVVLTLAYGVGAMCLNVKDSYQLWRICISCSIHLIVFYIQVPICCVAKIDKAFSKAKPPICMTTKLKWFYFWLSIS